MRATATSEVKLAQGIARPSTGFAEIIIGPNAIVRSTDEAAGSLFKGLVAPDAPLFSALVAVEKSGIIARGAAENIADAIATGRERLFDMTDGRTFMMSPLMPISGDRVIRFVDVSFVVRTVLSQERDVLTGLPNRVELVRRIEEHLVSKAPEERGAVLFLDLDKFKLVNDTLGHPVGDRLLKLVTERLSRALGQEGFIARIGGDEFVVLLEDARQPNAAEAVAKRIIDLVGRTYLVQGHSVQIGVSVGVARAQTDGETAEELIKNADLALFKAKSQGRSTYRFFTEEMDAEMQQRRSLEMDLQRALVLEQFHIVYQPQFQTGHQKLVGFEALLRWTSPERGNVSPVEFISVAEDIGLIDRIGEWVLRRACMDAATWPQPLSVSVNVSPVQFKNPRFVETVLSALGHSGLDATRLDIEITEGALMDDTEATITVLNRLKALGVKISMDDFGTGYSSLSYLQRFPFDKIKIDQSFIRSMETSADSASIVRAITALGQSLGMTTVAEGVETESQLSKIIADGCNQVQGYYTGRPMLTTDATRLAMSINGEKISA